MASPKVSVIVPCYNATRFLDETIHSLRSQTYQNIEILAVNDGSTDETQAYLERHAASDSRVRHFTQNNSGPSAARNLGMRNATGDYVCFLDADDVYLPEKIERQAAFLTEHPGVDLVYSDYFTSDSELNLTGLTAVRLRQKDILEAIAMHNYFPPSVPMFRRTKMETVGGFDESLRMTEDWDYWIRWAKVGAFAYLPGATTIYRIHPVQVHKDLHNMFRAGKKVLRKHFKTDRARYQRALASWYEAHAKERWATDQRLKTGAFLAFSAFHKMISAAAQTLKRPDPRLPDLLSGNGD